MLILCLVYRYSWGAQSLFFNVRLPSPPYYTMILTYFCGT